MSVFSDLGYRFPACEYECVKTRDLGEGVSIWHVRLQVDGRIATFFIKHYGMPTRDEALFELLNSCHYAAMTIRDFVVDNGDGTIEGRIKAIRGWRKLRHQRQSLANLFVVAEPESLLKQEVAA